MPYVNIRVTRENGQGLLWRVTFLVYSVWQKSVGASIARPYMTTCRVCINKFFRSDLL